MDNEFSEYAVNQACGVLPMRRMTDFPGLRLRDPALHAMTDFTRRVPVSVVPERQIDEALADMMRFGVRALLVLSGDSIVGLITARDILGPRPASVAGRSNGLRREQMCVRDIMTQWGDMPTVDWSTMQSARVRDLLEIFEGIGVSHLLVVEGDDRGVPVVRGLVSRAHIERRVRPGEIEPRMTMTAQHG
jgi:CBS domain-containing protein